MTIISRFVLSWIKTFGKKVGPKIVEVINVEGIYFSSMRDSKDLDLLSKEITGGVDKDPYLSLIKGYSEWFERTAVSHNCLSSTNGVAGWPIVFSKSYAEKKAVENAIKEAVERYVWITWLQDYSISFEIHTKHSGSLYKLISNAIPNGKLKVISIKNSSLYFVYLSILELEHGFLIGAGANKKESDAEEQSLSELFRHVASYQQLETGKMTKSKYADKLIRYATKGKFLFERLRINGGAEVSVPGIKKITELSHENEKLFVIIRADLEKETIFNTPGYI